MMFQVERDKKGESGHGPRTRRAKAGEEEGWRKGLRREEEEPKKRDVKEIEARGP